MKRKPLEPGKYFCFFFSVIFISCVLTGCSRRDDLFQEGSQEMADEEEFQITDQETANTQVPVSEGSHPQNLLYLQKFLRNRKRFMWMFLVLWSVREYTVWMQAAGYWDAIEAAGGCTTDDGATVCLNLAADAFRTVQKVDVPTVQEARSRGSWKWRGWLCWRIDSGAGYTGRLSRGRSSQEHFLDRSSGGSSGTGIQVNLNPATGEELLTALPGRR